MAWLFHLAAECGPDAAAAEMFARHFRGVSPTLIGGLNSVWHATLNRDGEGNWWCMITPGGVSRSGVHSTEDARQMAAHGSLLYEQLRTAPPFRYALVGIEAQEFRTFSELKQTDFGLFVFDGLVLSRDVWEQLNRPAGFIPFAAGYLWRPAQT